MIEFLLVRADFLDAFPHLTVWSNFKVSFSFFTYLLMKGVISLTSFFEMEFLLVTVGLLSLTTSIVLLDFLRFDLSGLID